jgi:hypothetical protein
LQSLFPRFFHFDAFDRFFENLESLADNGKPLPMSAGRYKARLGLSCLRGDGGWVPAILAQYVDVLAGGVPMCYIKN